jgi:16S rRNA processing protein RimM
MSTQSSEPTGAALPPAGAKNPRKGKPANDANVYYVRNQAVVVPPGYLAVGQIVGAHGLYGELKVEAYSDYPERFAPGKVLFLGEELEQVTVTTMRPHKTNLLVRLAEVDDRNDAEDVRGLWLYVPEAEAATLEAGEFWIHDIIGLRVVTVDGVEIGKITDVMATGANDVYVVRANPEINGGRDVLLPAIADVVEQVDLAQKTMVIRLLEGLIDG